MNSDSKHRDHNADLLDSQLGEFLKEHRRVPSENQWLQRRIMAALPDKKQRRVPALRIAAYLGLILLLVGGWVAGGFWFLSNEPSLTSLLVLCSIPLTTMFSGAVVAAPVLKRLFT